SQVFGFGGEGILVETNFLNRVLGRKCAAAKTIDHQRRRVAVARGRSGERGEHVAEIGWIVGQGIEIVVFEDDGRLVLRWIYADFRRLRLAGDVDLLTAA